ncbi:MAG: class I SAM-dependent methyltransferase [Verrucomicrobiia bacterium]
MERILKAISKRRWWLAQWFVRGLSSEYHAYSDLFHPFFAPRAGWGSGLGPAVFTLYGLARTLRPETIVEIGSARGKSTCALALACRQNGCGKIYAIDPHTTNLWSEGESGENTDVFLRRRLRTYRLTSYCEIIKASSAEASKTWSRKIDLLFIDGDHTYEGVKLDFDLFAPWCSEQALILFHDTMWDYLKADPSRRSDQGVPRFLDELRQRNYHSVNLWAPPGLALLSPRPGGFRYLESNQA